MAVKEMMEIAVAVYVPALVAHGWGKDLAVGMVIGSMMSEYAEERPDLRALSNMMLFCRHLYEAALEAGMIG